MERQPRVVRADTHVHFHACFERGAFFDAAAENLGIEIAADSLLHGLLCLTETAEAHWFEELARDARNGSDEGRAWRIRETDEPCSLLATDSSERVLALVAGRQIVTREGLEVLALGSTRRSPDGQPIETVLRDVSREGAIPVIPWGFGKWWGRRGAMVERLMRDPPCRFLLGDNGGRPASLPEPRLIARAAEYGIGVVAGTDPLPFSWESRRVGTFGIEWAGGASPMRPFSDLARCLTDPDAAFRRYGRPGSLAAFVRSQAAQNFDKRISKTRMRAR